MATKSWKIKLQNYVWSLYTLLQIRTSGDSLVSFLLQVLKVHLNDAAWVVCIVGALYKHTAMLSVSKDQVNAQRLRQPQQAEV